MAALENCGSVHCCREAGLATEGSQKVYFATTWSFTADSNREKEGIPTQLSIIDFH